MAQARKTVLVTDPCLFIDTVKSVLKDTCEIAVIEKSDTLEEIKNKAKRTSVILTDGAVWKEMTVSKVADEILACAKNLQLIASTSIGFDAYTKHFKGTAVKVTNSAGSCETAVAEHGVGLAIAACRRFEEGYRAIRNDEWSTGFTWNLGQEIYGSVAGIVGLGNIGLKVAKILRGMGVSRILYTARSKKEQAEKDIQAEFVTFEQLTSESDIIFICVPHTPATNNLFNDAVFKRMKKTAVVINIARGGVVDQEALIRALKNHDIFGAALDVMTPEPIGSDHELTKLPNCFLQPHTASGTVRSRRRMVEVAAQNALAFIQGKPLPNEVQL